MAPLLHRAAITNVSETYEESLRKRIKIIYENTCRPTVCVCLFAFVLFGLLFMRFIHFCHAFLYIFVVRFHTLEKRVFIVN